MIELLVAVHFQIGNTHNGSVHFQPEDSSLDTYTCSTGGGASLRKIIVFDGRHEFKFHTSSI
jgi:hypothetical protein